MTDYTNTNISDPAIKKMLDNYFEVMHKQDMNLFDTVFHKDCALYSAQTGEISLRPYAVYRDVVANRKSPFDTGNTRRDKVLMFDQISPTLAVVRVQLEMFGGVMQDYLKHRIYRWSMDDFGKDVGKSWRLSRLIPAYRATLLFHARK